MLRSYAWGLDIAESLDEAAGVGGLLLFRESAISSSNTVHFATFDGNGNVTGLVRNTGDISAQYEYDPFGELIRATGGWADENPLTLTTKFRDEETDLTYFGHRYLSASLGRWLNRDPIEEEDGPHLYAFIGNDRINAFDLLGLTKGGKQKKPPTGWENATPEEIQKEIDRLKAKNDPKYKEHIRSLEGWRKIRKSQAHYDNKFGKSKGKSGHVSVKGITAVAATTVVMYAWTKLNTSLNVLEMRDAISMGMTFTDQTSSGAQLYDFLVHLDSGDTVAAEIDALMYAVISGGGLAAWDALMGEMK